MDNSGVGFSNDISEIICEVYTKGEFFITVANSEKIISNMVNNECAIMVEKLRRENNDSYIDVVKDVASV